MDTTLCLDKQIAHITKSIHYQLHSLRIVRRSINTETASLIASAYILPIFDYCNFALHNIPDIHLSGLQVLQNSIVRCIFKIDKFSHTSITPYLMKLHWLPIKSRCLYKSLLIAHKAIHHSTPDYLATLIHQNTSLSRTNRSSTLILPSKYQLHTTNIRSWAISTPYSWNSLPPNIRSTTTTSSFKTLLKTHLFKLAFDN